MPTKPAARKPVRRPGKPIKPVKPMGSKPLVIVLAIILVLVVGITAYYLYKGPSPTAGGRQAGQPKSTVDGQVADDSAASDVRMAVAKARLQIETADNKPIIKVVIDKATATDGRQVTYKFDWTLNGQAAGDGTDRLSGFKRGDRVGVKVTPVEGDKPGQARFLDFTINNMPPQVEESKQVSFDGKTFTYQVKGFDPDGDTLSYTLEDAPQGMTINSQTGLVTWQITDGDYGERTFKVRIDDGKSGTATHPVKVDISKPSEEAKPPDGQK